MKMFTLRKILLGTLILFVLIYCYNLYLYNMYFIYHEDFNQKTYDYNYDYDFEGNIAEQLANEYEFASNLELEVRQVVDNIGDTKLLDTMSKLQHLRNVMKILVREAIQPQSIHSIPTSRELQPFVILSMVLDVFP